MGSTDFGPAIGARATIEIINETKYGQLRPGSAFGTLLGGGETEMAVPFTSEAIAHTKNELVSATLNRERGIKRSVSGSSDVAGDINFELRAEGHSLLIKNAMTDGGDGSANYVKVVSARGDIAVQADGYAAALVGVLPIKCEREIMVEWADIWGATPVGPVNFVHIRRDAATGNMTAYPETFSAIDGGTLLGNLGDPKYRHSLTTAALVEDVYDNSWIFPVDGALFPDAYLHYFELGANLPIGLNVDILRDIALFVYTGMKINTWTMNFNAGEIVNGTMGFVGKAEHIGAELVTEFDNDGVLGNVTISVSDGRIFNNWPGASKSSAMLMIGGEGEIYYRGNISTLENLDDTPATPPWTVVGDITLGAAAADLFHYLGTILSSGSATQAPAGELLIDLIPGERYKFTYTVTVTIPHVGVFTLDVGAVSTVLDVTDGTHEVWFTAPLTAAGDSVIINEAGGAVANQLIIGNISMVQALSLDATLDTAAGLDNSFPVSINTIVGLDGAINAGTDETAIGGACAAWPVNWGYYAGNPINPMSTRANDGASGPVDIQAAMRDLEPFTFFEAHIQMTTGLEKAAGREQGLQNIEVMSGNFTLDNGIYTDKYALGDKFRKKAPEQQRNLTGTLNFEFDDMQQYNKFYRDRHFGFVVRCISESVDTGLVNDDCPYSMCFYFRRCKYTGNTPNIGDAGLVMTDMPFRAMRYDGVSAVATPYYDKKFSEMAVWITSSRSLDLWS